MAKSFEERVAQHKRAMARSKGIKGDLSLLGHVTHINGKAKSKALHAKSKGHVASKKKDDTQAQSIRMPWDYSEE